MNLAAPLKNADDQDGVTVLVADDSQAFCSRLAQLLSRTPGVRQVIEATDARSALDHLQSGETSIAAIDAHLGDQPGTPLFRRIREAFPDITLLALTRFTSPAIAETYRSAGADECFDKNEALDEVLRAISQRITVDKEHKKENQS